MSQPEVPGGWPDPPSGPAGSPPHRPQWQPPHQAPPPEPPAVRPAPGYGPPAFPGPGYGPPAPVPPGFGYPLPPPTNSMSVTSMVLSIVAMVVVVCGTACFFVLGLIGLPLGVVGAVLGHLAMRQVRERGERGFGMAVAGTVVGWIATAAALAVLLLIVLYFAGVIGMVAFAGSGGFDSGVS